MQTSTVNDASQNEVTILARIFDNDENKLSAETARYILTLGFSNRDKARMHDLAVRNQEDALSHQEKDELVAYAKADSLLSILQSKARRVLGVKPRKRTLS